MKPLLALFLLLHGSIFCLAQSPEKHTVYFELDKAEIDTEQKLLFETWLRTFTDTATKLEIIGFADYLGSDAYNMNLSQRRADEVAKLLENRKTLQYRMSLVSAKGETLSKPGPDTANGNPQDRKVEILVYSKPKPKPVPNPTELKTKQAEAPRQHLESDILLRAEVGQSVVLKNLNFFPGRHFLIPKALPELERLAEILKENPTMEIEIQGHICCKLDTIDGLDVNTQTYSLSFNRAKYIFDQLVLAGIDPERMRYRGFAGGRPLIKPEMTDEDRQRNRRVEIRILKK